MSIIEEQLQYFYQTYQEERWFWLALLFSAGLHAIVLISIDGSRHETAAHAPQRAIDVSLNFLQAQSSATPEQKVEPVSKPVSTKTLEPRQAKTHKQKTVTASRRVQPTPATAPRQATNIQRGAAEQGRPVQQRYLSDLLNHIESFKYYPQSARRRGLDGAVNVSFHLLNSGDINGLSVAGGPVLLQHASRQAVQQSLPMPTPPAEITTPMQVSFVMQYRLN